MRFTYASIPLFEFRAMKWEGKGKTTLGYQEQSPKCFSPSLYFPLVNTGCPHEQFYSVTVGGEHVARQSVQERTMRVTVPFVRLRMATASSCVTPSRLCPLTAMI